MSKPQSVAGQRWRIEECFTVAKDQLGLSEYEVRSWCGWHRHMSLVMAAQAFLNVLRHQVEPMPLPKKIPTPAFRSPPNS